MRITRLFRTKVMLLLVAFLGLFMNMNAFMFMWTPRASLYLRNYSLAGASSEGDVVNIWSNAVSAHQAGEVEVALDAYDQVLTMFDVVPDDTAIISTLSAVHGNKGAIYMSTGDYEKARDAFQAACLVSPNNAMAQFNLAVVLTSKFGDHRKALRHCKLAIKLEPGKPNFLHLMANILQELGAQEEAERYYRMAEAASNSDSDQGDRETSMAWGHLASSLATAEKGQIIAAGGLEMECVSARPHIFYIPALLTEEECDYLIERSRPHLENSFVMGGGEVDGRGGADPPSPDPDRSPHRVSDVAWLPPDDLLKHVQERLATLTGFDVKALRGAAEELQVIHYSAPGGVFKAHHDSTGFNPRLLTALIYLNSLSLGGEGEGEGNGGTWFPFAHGRGGSGNGSSPHLTSVNEAVAFALGVTSVKEQGMTIAPKKGSAVLFFNHAPDGTVDPLAVHAGLPVFEGEKWAANYWYGGLP